MEDGYLLEFNIYNVVSVLRLAGGHHDSNTFGLGEFFTTLVYISIKVVNPVLYNLVQDIATIEELGFIFFVCEDRISDRFALFVSTIDNIKVGECYLT